VVVEVQLEKICLQHLKLVYQVVQVEADLIQDVEVEDLFQLEEQVEQEIVHQ